MDRSRYSTSLAGTHLRRGGNFPNQGMQLPLRYSRRSVRHCLLVLDPGEHLCMIFPMDYGQSGFQGRETSPECRLVGIETLPWRLG